MSWWVVIGLILAVALIFEFVNGFHDTANAVATSIATKAISPRGALLLAAGCNFVGAMLSTRVAATVGRGIVREECILLSVILAGVAAGLVWNLLTWYLSLPTSSSHALIGGLAGAAIAAMGFSAINWSGLLKILLSLLISPVIGLCGGYLFFFFLHRILPDCERHNELFRRLQLASASLIALSHGSNDAQKMMGVITMALFSAGLLPSIQVPVWVMLLCAVTITLGTAAGGWRIIKTLGIRLTKLYPCHGFAAETSSVLVISAATFLGAPVSTTHVVTTSIMGVGAYEGRNNVSWPLATGILLAWLLTLPLSGLLAAGFYHLMTALFV